MYTYTDVKNLRWANTEHTVMDCDVTFDHVGTVPFSTSQEDLTEHGSGIFNRAVAGDFGPIEPFTPPVVSLDTLKSRALAAVGGDYQTLCSGRDPVTGKQIYVDCTVGETTYRMNAGKEAAKSMDEGVRIYERAGATHMPVVRDFYNVNYENVPMADAISISLQQGADALTYWQSKCVMVDAITSADSVGDLEAIDFVFPVSVLP